MTAPYIGVHDSTGVQLLPLLADPTTDPILIEKLEVDPPNVRAQTQDRAQAHGASDRTRYYGAAAVTLEGTFVGDDADEPWTYADRLKALWRVDRRNYLHVQRVDWPELRRIQFRGDKPTAALTEIQSSFQFTAVAPGGMWEAVDEDAAYVFPLNAATPGLALPWTLPMAFPPGGSPGGLTLQVGGTVDCYPIVDLYGKAGGAITIEYAGRVVTFKSSAAVEPGHFWRIDFDAHTVLVDGDPSLSRYDQIDFPNSDWWSLEPGPAVVSLQVPDPDVGCHAVLRWRRRWLP